ncbi:MAG: ZIP family metal transporter [Christensenellaceae bacterium]|jgi:ZIP family zinc transporter|nr:ZIP family metal transporter [Christensenellaceae bacterium]
MFLDDLNPVVLALVGTSISLTGTVLGAAFSFFTGKAPKVKTQKMFLGFASGVMIASAIWSLLLPASEYAIEQNMAEWLPTAVGFVAGAAFLFLMDKLLPHWHAQSTAPEGLKSGIGKSAKLVFAVTLHNFPEGLAVGLAFALAGSAGGDAITPAAAIALAIGIAIQNVPEGAVISIPLKNEGHSKIKSFLYGSLSGVVEPFAGVIGAVAAVTVASIIPWALSFAAGAMIYVVVDELVPDASSEHTDLGTLGAIAGFVLMMVLDMAFA